MTSDLGKIKILNREKSRSWTRKNQGQEKMATEDDIVGWYHWLNEHVSESHSAVSKSLQTHGLYSHWNSPGQNTEVSSLSLLQGIFPTQGLKPGLPHCRWILYQLSHQGSPRTLEWVTYPFSSGSSQPRNPYGVSCIAGGFFTNWATRRHEFENILGDSEGQGSLACCSPWGRKDLGTTDQLNNSLTSNSQVVMCTWVRGGRTGIQSPLYSAIDLIFPAQILQPTETTCQSQTSVLGMWNVFPYPSS